MKQLATVELDRIDEKDGIVYTWYNGGVERLCASQTVPAQVIGAAIK